MNRMTGSTSRSDQVMLTDALVRVEISYLDSATNYRELLPVCTDTSKRVSMIVVKARVSEYRAFGQILLIVVVVIAIIVRLFD